MKLFLTLVALCLGSSAAFIYRDDEACAVSPAVPTPREVDANTPQGIFSLNFNYSDPAGSNYPPNTVCEWHVTMDDPDQTQLQIAFFNFSLDYKTDCRGDSVSIFDGADDTAPLLGGQTWCGDSGDDWAPAPDPMIATNKELFVRFESDDTIEDRGFLARVGFPLEDNACDGTGPQIYTGSGFFMTKDYPVDYVNNVWCEYKFEAAAGEKIEIYFEDFGAESSCQYDYLQVYNGPTGSSPFQGRWWDVHKPARMISSGQDLYMSFESDSSITERGFFGWYRTVPV